MPSQSSRNPQYFFFEPLFHGSVIESPKYATRFPFHGCHSNMSGVKLTAWAIPDTVSTAMIISISSRFITIGLRSGGWLILSDDDIRVARHISSITTAIDVTRDVRTNNMLYDIYSLLLRSDTV